MAVNIQTLKDIRVYLADELKDHYSDPEIKALSNIIIKTTLGISRLHDFYNNDLQVSLTQAHKITEICNELKTGKPIQYIIGEAIFYDCRIKVNGSTLIPRPETEELVDLIIKENRGFNGNIIDFGTGSGCIAIALAVNMPESVVTGIDISDDALGTAEENRLLNNTKVVFRKDDILNFKNTSALKADIIVSNPPYVRISEKKNMGKNVLGFEPHLALFVNDEDPLVFYRKIIEIAGNILEPDGKIYFEINEAFGNITADLLSESGFKEISVIKDLNGRDRIVKGKKYG